MAELESMEPRGSQYLAEGDEIPEKNWLYRLAKRFFYNDFGAYQKAGFKPGPRRGEEQGAADQTKKKAAKKVA